MTASAHDHPHSHDVACDVAHGIVPVRTPDRRLVAVFVSPVTLELAHIATHVGFQVVIVDPDPLRDVDRVERVVGIEAAALDEYTDVVVTDHDRPELGDVLADALRATTRWIGVMGSLRHTAPHIEALRNKGFDDTEIARIHRPIGLDIGSHSPAEIAVATVAGLLADRNGRTGGQFQA